ncbi:ABC transporter permease [Marinihelvus fidelis]|uniref:ABC transporter permease n=1 Tax=Marinihelvus fidelis TaxID=2613842 RepID=A0A5N0TDR4_9GAMM|nr:ABC transporter permease [Marinihelvus fidelis]KAA9131439.1 ABC transporter permease [Marinihelvus fidelis]
MFSWFTQVFAVIRFSLASLPQRLGSSLTALLGIAGVVAVMVGVLSIAQGVLQTMRASADGANVIVLRAGADTEMTSGLGGDEVRVIKEGPGLARDADGVVASAELFVIINLPMASAGTDANVPLRGIEMAATKVRDGFEIVDGRMYTEGLNEVVVGLGAAEEFAGLAVGDTIEVGQEDWPVVGHFSTGGGIGESEIWVDSRVLQNAYRRGNSYQAVYARLASPEAFTELKDELTTDARLSVQVQRETEYYEAQSTALYNMITGLGTVIALIMGLGAIFGALNTMYTAVSARTREIATLRALGFRSGPVVLSVLAESLLLALVGGAIGGSLAWLAFDGFRAATLNWASFSAITFSFDVNLPLLIQGIVFAAIIGLIGGFFPAIRAARTPVALALREQ